ncbi:ExbD/TolR family protein [Mastigocoleus testarum]|uniref:Biopolymer transporter ExbD n=1 Tax=Mastigocoleus testarum BC008 TaxID=371196 RepID=A0A0V7ZN25_9CYAN|nr:biopolymer transporter ExbD [Mastigocoleus testarum]KST65883.1 biopolymer transporter ExbD [Mastigocoleus testarum BC008]
MRLPEEPDLPPQINIVPMIDVIFAILTFFILSSLFLTRLEGIPVNLPKAGTAEKQTAEPLTITVDPKGNISLNRKSTNLDELTQQMRQLALANGEQLVVVNADEKVSHGRVIAIMDRLRQIKGVKLAIATERPN